MGRRGPRPGTPRHDGPTAAHLATVGDGKAPPKPPGLSKAEAAEWARVCPTLARMGLLTRVDGFSLEVYCREMTRYRALCKTVAQFEPESLEGARVDAQRRAAQDAAQKAAEKIGLSPNSRARIRIAAPEATKNELEAFLT